MSRVSRLFGLAVRTSQSQSKSVPNPVQEGNPLWAKKGAEVSALLSTLAQQQLRCNTDVCVVSCFSHGMSLTAYPPARFLTSSPWFGEEGGREVWVASA